MSDILLQDFDYIFSKSNQTDCFRNKSFLITGATGLIGSLLVRYLQFLNNEQNLNLHITACVRDLGKAEKVLGETLNTDSLRVIPVDFISDRLPTTDRFDYMIHTAAVTASKQMVSDPVGAIKTSVHGTEVLLDYAVSHGCETFIYLSSMEAYGKLDGTKKAKESDLGYIDLSSVRSCYPESKRLCECLCFSYAAQYGINTRIVRLAQTFGAGILPWENRVFAQFARSAMECRDIVLHTEGKSEGNYVYTADAIAAILMLLNNGEMGQTYNVSNENCHTTIRHMAELVAEHIADGKIRVVIDIPENSSEMGYAPDTQLFMDSSRMRSLGWAPEVGLEEAYRRMIIWMKEL